MAFRIFVKLPIIWVLVMLPVLAWAQYIPTPSTTTVTPGGPATPTTGGDLLSYMQQQTQQALQAFNNVQLNDGKANQESFFDNAGMNYGGGNSSQQDMTSFPIGQQGGGDGNN